MTTANNRQVDYIELGCADTARVKEFYGHVFGWQFRDYGPGYTCFNDGRLRGGFTTEIKPGPGGALIVLYASDLTSAEAKIRAAGGSIVVSKFEFPGGQRFHFADTEGNVLAVWSEL